MTEVTRVPLQPIAPGSLTKLWIGVALALALAVGAALLTRPAGVSIETLRAGTGESPGATDVVFVNYTGKLQDGTVFDESQPPGWPVPGILPDGAALSLEQMIPGFREALMQMQKGGSYTVEIPSDLAYGSTPPPGAPIPPDADLVFDVELVDFMTLDDAEQRYNRMMQALQSLETPPAGLEGLPPPEGAPPAPVPAP